MVSELMTGYADTGVSLPLSRITVGAFQDLGYRVNYSAADAYTKPSLRGAVGSTPVTRAASGATAPVAPGRSLLARAESAAAVARPAPVVAGTASEAVHAVSRAFVALAAAAETGSVTPLRRGGISNALASRPLFAAVARG
jgi:hypothetical protein